MIGSASCQPVSLDKAAVKNEYNPPVSKLTLADVRARLETAGLTSEVGGKVEQSFLDVPGTLLRIPEAELQVYIYPNSAARAGDTAELDPVKVAPPTMRVTWIKPVSLVTFANIAVIVLTLDEALRRRVRVALTGS